MIEAMKHYEAALLKAFPRGATGDVFEHWNKARQAIAEADKQERFFCERCGKRLSGGIHTCTPPAEAEKQEPVAMQMDLIVVNLVREGINKHRARELAEHFIKHTHPQPKREPLTGVIEVKKIGYHSLQLIFESQDAIKKFKATHGIKGEA
jgi:hypothetical protein